MGQIQTASSLVALTSALLLGALTLRFRGKSLLMAGLVFVGISALGGGLAPNFGTMLVLYSLAGLGTAVVVPMTTALVADHFPLEKRTHAIGWLLAAQSLSTLVGSPIVGFIAGLWGWRWAFLGFSLPITLLSLLLVVKGLPSKSRNREGMMSKRSHLEGFRGIFASRSAVASLIGVALSAATWQAVMTYSASFLRHQFLIPLAHVSLFFIVMAFLYTVGSLTTGRLVNRAGRKPITVVAVLLTGIFLSFYIATNLWLSLSLAALCVFFASLRATASSSLALEQVPRFPGTMMSLNSAAFSMGSLVGAGLGGLALLLLDYRGLGVIFGSIGVVAAIVFQMFVIDPTKTPTQRS